MSVEASVLHATLAACLDELDVGGGEITAAAIIVCVHTEDEDSVETFSDRTLYFEQLGLFHAALETIKNGYYEDDE